MNDGSQTNLSERTTAQRKGRVLFAGQAYYHFWYLSRELRKIGWDADLLNWETHPENERFYHGEDFFFDHKHPDALKTQVEFYFWALDHYDIFHFANMDRMNFGPIIHQYFISQGAPPFTELDLIKHRGKKIVYTMNGCKDGVLQSSFMQWKVPESMCLSCKAKDNPEVCSDRLNAEWGILRNRYADYQMTIGGDVQDYNCHPTVHEVPESYNMDHELWSPEIVIPPEHNLNLPEDTFKIFHAVGNFDIRTIGENRNTKSSHHWLPLIERLKSDGYKVELIFCHDKRGIDVRYYQAQSDMIAEMLTYGVYGSTAREGMMLGKPVVCYQRPEWLENIRREYPEFVENLPVISADPNTVYDVVVDLIKNPEKRIEIGKKSRDFAVRFHSSKSAAIRFDKIYSGLLGISGDPATEPIRYSTYLKYGETELHAGKYESAKSYFGEVFSRFPTSEGAIKGLATALFNLGEIEKVLEVLNNLTNQDKHTINLTAQCAEALKNFPVANELYRAVLAVDSADPQALAGVKRTMSVSL